MTKKHLTQNIILLISGIFISLLIGALLFSYLEGWALLDAFYFVTMTATTVGYGDFVPTSPISKILTIIFALSIIPFVLYTFSFVAKAQMEKLYKKIHRLEKKQEHQQEALSQEKEENNIQDQELEVVEKTMEDIVKKPSIK